MTKNQSLLFRVLLFIAGAGIVIHAFFSLTGDRELTAIDVFVGISVGLMYLIFFLPFFFSVINIGNFSGKIPAISMVWLGIIIYIVASVTVIFLLTKSDILSLPAAVVIQVVLFFIFLVNIFFAYFAASHVGKVASQEAEKLQYITQIKTKAQVLLLTVNKLPAEYEKTQKILKQVFDDIRYTYPGDAGGEIELKILHSLGIVSELLGNIQSGAHPAALESEALNLQALVKERKLLRD
jgi:hypothetical protein